MGNTFDDLNSKLGQKNLKTEDVWNLISLGQRAVSESSSLQGEYDSFIKAALAKLDSKDIVYDPTPDLDKANAITMENNPKDLSWNSSLELKTAIVSTPETKANPEKAIDVIQNFWDKSPHDDPGYTGSAINGDTLGALRTIVPDTPKCAVKYLDLINEIATHKHGYEHSTSGFVALETCRSLNNVNDVLLKDSKVAGAFLTTAGPMLKNFNPHNVENFELADPTSYYSTKYGNKPEFSKFCDKMALIAKEHPDLCQEAKTLASQITSKIDDKTVSLDSYEQTRLAQGAYAIFEAIAQNEGANPALRRSCQQECEVYK